MNTFSKLTVFVFALSTSAVASADPLRIATWNLGWHVSQAEVSPWISQCSKTYAKDDSGVWRIVPTGTPQAKRGWEIKESRATLEGVDLSVMPPCSVYMSPAREGVEVTADAYAKRSTQIARLLASDVRPDVIAFQEVSGTAAVREALGASAVDYHVCSFDGAYKIQRLAFAWKRAYGVAEEACADLKAISLPGLPTDQQVRPGYITTLKLAEQRVRFLTLHLKSSCVTPLEGDVLDKSTGANDPCLILQQQVAPLEAAVEQLGADVDHFVILGDFNRNLWHEANKVKGAEAIRSDGETDLAKPRASNVVTRNLLLEVSDGMPPLSSVVLLSPSCPGTSEVKTICEASKTTKLDNAQRQILSAPEALGCRNPVGLDFILVSKSLANSVRHTAKVSIGSLGRSLPARPPAFSVPLLAVSDHCPMVAEIDF